jgi:diguanylate cyclase (GGDEF)-like protein/PAS domain S-box-containing protein
MSSTSAFATSVNALLRTRASLLLSLFRPPAKALDRVRWVFWLLAIANLLFVTPMLAFGDAVAGPARLAAAVATVGLGCWWARVFVRGYVPWLSVIPEVIALLVITVGVGDPVRASGVLYTGLYFRATYGSPLAVVAATLAFLGALVGAELSSGALGAATIQQLITNAIGLVSVSLLMQVVVRALIQHEQSHARERSLRKAGTALVAASDRDSVVQAALEAIPELTRDSAARGALWFGDLSDEPHVIASCSSCPADELTLQALSEHARAQLFDGHPVELEAESPGTAWLLVPLTLQDELRGVLGIWTARRLSREIHESLRVLASEMALALETMTLSEDLHRRKGEERFRALVQHAADVIVILGADGYVRYTSPAAVQAWGRSSVDLEGTPIRQLVHPEDRETAAQLIDVVQKSGETSTAEFRLAHTDGSWRDFEVVATNLLQQAAVGGIVLNCHDVTESKALGSQLRELAFHDPLTGLANRALLADRLEHALARANRQHQPVAMMLLDLDDFKFVNDSLGHQAGDALLSEVGVRVRRCLRTEDTAARLGGDEFAVLLEDVRTQDEVLTVAERLLAELRDPIAVAGREVTVGMTIGVTLSTPAGESYDDLIRRADLALYRAKAQRKGSYALFDPSMEATAMQRLEIESDLRHALERGELRLVYQPILTLQEGHLAEVEALLRWQHPRRGTISPADFIPVAEETGLIVPIGQWVLEEACRQARAWHQQYPSARHLVMSVNLSARQFQRASLVADVERTLRQTGIDPHCLKLEITESVLMHDVETAIATCRALKELDVQLAIDDFGTGYSSLGQLKRLPFDTLKIDRSFVDGLGNDEQDTAIVQSVVTLAKSLNLSVTAEGIETQIQHAQLRLLGCERGQGFLFARPQGAELITALFGEDDESLRRSA